MSTATYAVELLDDRKVEREYAQQPQRSCPCAPHYHLGDVEHHKLHALFEKGVPLPPSMHDAADGEILVVPANRRTAAATVAYKMACVAKRAEGWDFPSFPAHPSAGSEDWRRYRLTAYLAVAQGRAVGYASVLQAHDWSIWAWGGD